MAFIVIICVPILIIFGVDFYLIQMLIILTCFPILTERIGIIRKLNRNKLVSYRIKYNSMHFINPKKGQKNHETQKLYLIYNLMTIIRWIYWISFPIIFVFALFSVTYQK